MSGDTLHILDFTERPAKGQHEVLEGRMALETRDRRTKPVVDLVERADLGRRGQVLPDL